VSVSAAIIYNPSAGKSRGEAIASSVRSGLAKRGLHSELHATGGPRDATSIARRLASVVDVIVAVGGDGTMNEVVNGIAQGSADPGSCASLGIVPAGTVNVLALELGLSPDVERACDIIAAQKTTLLDLGDINSRKFVLMTGAGIDALTVKNIDPRAKRRYKELAFVGTGLRRGFAAPPPQFCVRVDGHAYRSTFFVAGNCRYYAGHLGITTAADPSDGLLDLVIFAGTTRTSLAVFWLEVLSGRHLRDPNVVHLRAEGAELMPIDETIWFQTDGELAGKLPATVKIQPRALRVLVP